jgi:iron(III) transport system substrate-binding protein
VPASLRISALAATVALTAALASCSTGGGSPAASSSVSLSHESVSALTQQARREHGLMIYANIPSGYLQPVISAFNKRYPFIKISAVDLSDNVVFSKYETEAAQGARTADMLIASAPALWVQAERNGVSAGVTPTGLSAFPSWVNQGHGVFIMSAEPILLTHNDKLLTPSQVPTTYAQLAADAKANPAKYKLVSYSITNPLDYAGIYGLAHLLGPTKLWSYYAAMAPVTKTFDDGLTALTYMLQGGASLGYMTSGLAQGVLPHYKGLASYTYMQDATPLIPRGITVTKNAASPASAQLFLDFLYTQAGQDALCAGGFEATMNNFHSANGCTASLTALQTHVPANTIYLVPINQTVVDQQSAITKRWNQSFHR